MATKTKKESLTEEQKLDVLNTLTKGRIEDICILGTSGLIFERMSTKARRQLLFPSGRMTTAAKAVNIKHPVDVEYRESVYTTNSPKSPTLIQALPIWFKKAAAAVALDVPATGNRAQLDRLMFAIGDRTPLWGIPMLHMAPVRQAGAGRAYDIRTRAIVPYWACRITLEFLQPLVTADLAQRLLEIAGFKGGVGGWRPQLGGGQYGCFDIVAPDDPRFLHIVETGGREAQIDAFENFDFYDDEARDLYVWWTEELVRRGRSGTATAVPEEYATFEETEEAVGGNGAYDA